MTQDEVAYKIMSELFHLKVCEEKDEVTIWEYLCQAYAAGYDEGRLQYHKRQPVAQYTVEGKLVKIWPSGASAARAYELDKTAISKACRGKTKTTAGFQWRFVNVKKPNASVKEKIGAVKGKGSRPTPRSRGARITKSPSPPSQSS